MPKSSPLRLYPRGFLGGDLSPQVKRTPNTFNDVMLHRFQYHVDPSAAAGPAQSTIPPNTRIESLYAQYVKRSGNWDSFEFRHEVFHSCMTAFGTADFSLWFQAQFKSPACGDLHRRFLDDTIKFIRTGRRDVSVETWSSLIVITDEGDAIGILSDFAKDFFALTKSMGHTLQSGQNNELTDILQQWCSHPSGFEDLLNTLHILFGNA